MQSHAQKGGVTFIELLTLLLIGLKLTGLVKWSWFWVLAPMILPLALFCVVGFIFVAIGLIFNNTYLKHFLRSVRDHMASIIKGIK